MRVKLGIYAVSALGALGLTGCASSAVGSNAAARSTGTARFQLESCTVEGVPTPVRCGTYEVFENRQARGGKKIGLKVVVLPATDPNPAPVNSACWKSSSPWPASRPAAPSSKPTTI